MSSSSCLQSSPVPPPTPQPSPQPLSRHNSSQSGQYPAPPPPPPLTPVTPLTPASSPAVPRHNHSRQSSYGSQGGSLTACSSPRTPLHKLKKQLSIGNIKRRIIPPLKADDSNDDDHLLEEIEPVAVVCSEQENNARNISAKKQPTGSFSGSSTPSRHQIPSSLVKLSEEEKRQLEDVLMRIGLKDCGL